MAKPNPVAGTTEGRFRLLVQSVTDYAIYLLDPEGFVSSWNAGAEKITGYTEAESLGQHVSRFFTAEDQAAGLPLKVLQLARRHGQYEIEGWRARKDRHRYWALTIIETVFDETGAHVGFAEVTRDITERHATQQALIESERRFRLLVQGVIGYSMFMLDPSGLVLNWNLGAERIKGYHADEIVGQHFSRFYTSEDRASGAPFRALETASREGRFEGEGWRMRKDGSRFWASVVIDALHDESGQLIGFAKITRDITERVAAQQALRDSERQFRLLVAGVTDYALFMLDPNGVVVSWNSGAEKIKGYRPHEIVGHHFSRFYTEQDRVAGLPARSLFAATTDGRFEAEGWRVRKDGSVFWASVVIDAIRDDDGKRIGFAKITRDITERREAQQALQRAHEQLAHAQKMEALGQLTGGIAHDFNNLLTVVSGQTQILKRHIAANPRAERAAAAIEIAAQRGEALTRRLLAFSRRQHLRPEPVDLHALADSLRTMLSSALTANIQLTTLFGETLWAVLADPSELELALVNLALNARDAMAQGGMITVSAKNVTMRPGQHGVDLAGDFVAVTVTDTGTGIPEDVLPKVFDPFFTTKSVDKGTGLGLAQVYGFVHQSAGSVSIDSQVGVGTRVTLYLPRTEAAPAQAGGADAVAKAGSARILVVEDNPDVAPVTAGMLDELGHAAVIVHSAEAALRKLEEDAAFDLVFTDVVMPGMDGFALAEALRAQYPNLPVLLTSGYTKTIETPRLDWPLLRKPFKLAELSRAVTLLTALAARSGDDPKLVDIHEARKTRASKNGRAS